MEIKFSSKTLNKLLLVFFVFGSLFISIRLLLIGSAAASNAGQLVISLLPEIIVLAVCGVFFSINFKKEQKLSIHLMDWLIVSYIILSVAYGLIIGKDLKIGLYGFRITYLPMLFYFVGSFYTSSKQDSERLIQKFFQWFLAIGFLGLIIYFLFFDFNLSMLLKVSSTIHEYFIVRLTSIFWSPVVFGTFSSITFLYFFYKSLQSTSFWNYLFQIILFTCTLMSMSRGAMIGLVLGVIVLTVLSKFWKKMLITARLMMVTFLPLSFYIDSPQTVIQWMVSSTANTIQIKKGDTRSDLSRSAIKEIEKYPFGHGLGKAGHVAVRFSKTDEQHANQDQLSENSTDGWFVKLACETGIIGLISYFMITIILFVFCIKKIRKTEFDFFSFLLTVFLVVNIQNLVSNVLDFYLFSYLYWFLIGIMVFYLKFDKKYENT